MKTMKIRGAINASSRTRQTTEAAKPRRQTKSEVQELLSRLDAAKYLTPALLKRATKILLSMDRELRAEVLQFVATSVREWRENQDFESLSRAREKRLANQGAKAGALARLAMKLTAR